MSSGGDLPILKMHHDGLALLVRDDKGFTPSRCDPAEVTALILSLRVCQSVISNQRGVEGQILEMQLEKKVA